MPAENSARPDRISRLGLWLVAEDLAGTHREGQPVLRWPDRSGAGCDAIFEGRIPQAETRSGIHHPPTFAANALGRHPAVSFEAAERRSASCSTARS